MHVPVLLSRVHKGILHFHGHTQTPDFVVIYSLLPSSEILFGLQKNVCEQ